MTAIKPRTETPDLEVQTLDGEIWRLSEQNPANFSLIVVYRGAHCPICRSYLAELDRMQDDFAQRGVEVIALSTDNQGRAQSAKEDWKLKQLRIGYGLSIEKAREWGLFISTSRGKTSLGIEEPALFAEPGIFLVKPDQTLYASNIASMPFARPHFKEIMGAVDFVVEKDYPARGEA